MGDGPEGLKHGEVDVEDFAETFFLLPESAVPGDRVLLPPAEAHHALHVLRLNAGVTVPATDGAGGRYRLLLVTAGKRCEAEVLERLQEPPPLPAIEIGVGMGRKERLLWGVEKLAELATRRVVPLLTSAVRGRRMLAGGSAQALAVKAQARAAAALKQSKGAHLTRVAPPAPLEEWAVQSWSGLSLLLTLPAPDVSSLARTAQDFLERPAGMAPPAEFRVAVGPEGGLNAREEELLRDSGFVPVHLGERRLRFETAAVAAASQLRGLWALRESACSS